MGRARRRRPSLLRVGALAVVGGVMAYLSECLPGLDLGTGTLDPVDPEPSEPVQPTAPLERAASVPTIVVEAARCRIDAEVGPCEAWCDRTDLPPRVEIDATLGSHGVVERLQHCLEAAGVSDVRIRSE